MVSSKTRRGYINVSQRTKDALRSIKHPGQSYDGLFQELVLLWEKEHGEKIGQPLETAVEVSQ